MTRKIREKISTKNKSYKLDQCALFSVKGFGQLTNILKTTEKKLNKLSSDDNYYLKNQEKPNGEIRHIQSPKQDLRHIHTKIASLLSRVEAPLYLHSGRKNKSYVTNAKEHIGKKEMLTVDLLNYYQSVSKKSVFWFFKNKLRMADDIANLLASICTYKDYIPTGSPLSMILAFYSSSEMFNRLNDFSKINDINMTVYVDDITFSGDKVDKTFKKNVKKIITQCGYKLNEHKTRLYKEDSYKIVTGCVLKNTSISPKNKTLQKWRSCKDSAEKEWKKLFGYLSSLGQINQKYNHIKNIIKTRLNLDRNLSSKGSSANFRRIKHKNTTVINKGPYKLDSDENLELIESALDIE